MQGASFSTFDTTGATGDFQGIKGRDFPRMQISVVSNNRRTADRDYHALQRHIIQLYYRC